MSSAITEAIHAALDQVATSTRAEDNESALKGAAFIDQGGDQIAIVLSNGPVYVLEVKPARIVVQGD